MGIRLIAPKVSGVQLAADTEIPEGITFIEAPKVWAQGHTGAGVVVAVIDTGVDTAHPDLAGAVIDGKNFTTEPDYSDLNGHGTHVVGTIASRKNGIGVVGVAPDAKVLALKVLDRNGEGDYVALIEALNYAVDWTGPNGEKVRVVSMSLGGPNDIPGLHVAIKRCVEAGILVVCAAGNGGDGQANTNEVAYPGDYPEVVCVGAGDTWGNVANFSNSNDEVDLIAPGVGVYSTYPGGQYRVMSGTSMATPHVSGAAAVITEQWEKDYGRKITEAELYAQLIKRTVTYDVDRRLQGAGMLRLTAGYAAPEKWETITFEQALEIAKSHVPPILDTPQFWVDMIEKYKRGELTNSDFRYVELAFRKWAAALV